ncbi:MAG: hypothetical protein HQL13_01265 [Candidatus Omnitrophica bacterium]|nr:hypothetical protein [Candidatus Omnitrophota bacterium]
MFPQFKKCRSESGVVLFFVLMSAIIIMMFSIGILTQSMNEINYAQEQIDEIAAGHLALGSFFNALTVSVVTTSTNLILTNSSQNESGRNYQLVFQATGTGPGDLSEDNQYVVTVSYNSLQ